MFKLQNKRQAVFFLSLGYEIRVTNEDPFEPSMVLKMNDDGTVEDLFQLRKCSLDCLNPDDEFYLLGISKEEFKKYESLNSYMIHRRFLVALTKRLKSCWTKKALKMT